MLCLKYHVRKALTIYGMQDLVCLRGVSQSRKRKHCADEKRPGLYRRIRREEKILNKSLN